MDAAGTGSSSHGGKQRLRVGRPAAINQECAFGSRQRDDVATGSLEKPRATEIGGRDARVLRERKNGLARRSLGEGGQQGAT
jgi:hypothetical protein